jgi:hypothetical protein
MDAAVLDAVAERSPARGELLPVLPALRAVVPGGGLRPGSVVGVGGDAALGLALLAGVCRHGGWCAAVGLPDLGVVAAADMGADPERLLLVDEPGTRWHDVLAALIEAVDLVLVRPPEPPSAPVARRLTALARRHGSVIAVATGEVAWQGSAFRLEIEASEWTGLGQGHGRLRARRALVAAHGRGAPERAWIWLPSPDGTVHAAQAPARPTLEVVA